MNKLKTIPDHSVKNWNNGFVLHRANVKYDGKDNVVHILKPHRAFNKGTKTILV